MKIEHFEELSSTQEYVKNRRSDGEDLLVTATRQTGGKGTKGRSFSSNEGGVYLSKLTFYEDFPVKKTFQIMAGAAVAVSETLRSYNIRACIKWPNDIFVNNRKICGILIENSLSGNRVSSSVVGIGLNVNNELPEELADIATSMKGETGKEFGTDEVRRRLIEELSKPADMKKYQAYLGYMGAEVVLIMGDERIPATILSVDEEGGLWVNAMDGVRRLTAAEVSIRV